MIEINELTKRYEDGVLALDHVTYKVEQGEIFCLLGANGAGKTTTINILLDFIQPTSGHAFINGHDCNKFPLEAKKYVSYVSENVQLYGMFITRQNLAFFAELAGKKGLTKKDYDDVIHTVAWHTWLASILLARICHPTLEYEKYIQKKSLTFSRDLRLNIKVMSLKPDLGLIK